MYNNDKNNDKNDNIATLDFKNILASVDKLNDEIKQINQQSDAKLSKLFQDEMFSSDHTHKAIGNHVNEVHKQVLIHFTDVFSSAKNHVENIQTMQSKEKPSDFVKRPQDDLSSKISTGVPLEEQLFFKQLAKRMPDANNNIDNKPLSVFNPNFVNLGNYQKYKSSSYTPKFVYAAINNNYTQNIDKNTKNALDNTMQQITNLAGGVISGLTFGLILLVIKILLLTIWEIY